MTVRGLMHRIKKKYGAQETLSDNVYEALHDVYDYVRSAYENSAVPKDEWPEIPEANRKLPENIDDVVESVIKIPGVLCCVKKMQRLEIYIDTPVAVEEICKQSVLQVLDKYNIENALFIYGNLMRFCTAGSPICGGLGTLGGFADRCSRNNATNNPKQVNCKSVNCCSQNPNLVALISKHVAMVSLLRQNKSNGSLKVSGKVIGYIERPDVYIPEHEWLDIVPVDVLENVQNECEKQFKTKEGLLKFATLTDEILCKGLPVHIWGSVSSPGLGYASDNAYQTDKNRYIVLTNYNDGTTFCQPGDSGSFVCTCDRKDVNLYAIAMLIGEFQPNRTEEYTTSEEEKSDYEGPTLEGNENQHKQNRLKKKIQNTTDQTPKIHSGVKPDDTQTAQNIDEDILIQSCVDEVNKNKTNTEEHANIGIENPEGRKIKQSNITDEGACSKEVKTEVTDQQRQGQNLYLALKLVNAFKVLSQLYKSDFSLCQEN